MYAYYISIILWHYLIKGFEDLKLFPDNYIAIQMLTIRLCRLKSMPDPQKIINDENLQNEIIIKNELNVKTQIKNVVQEKKETLTKKDNKIVNFISKINNFDDLICSSCLCKLLCITILVWICKFSSTSQHSALLVHQDLQSTFFSISNHLF